MSQSIKFEPRQTSALPSPAAASKRSPFDLRIVTSDVERAGIFALRWRAYEKLLESSPSGSTREFRDAFDDIATTVQIGAYDEGRLVGAMRLCFNRRWDGLETLPCANYYPELKAVKRTARGHLMEVSRFSIDTDISNTSYRTTLYASLVRTSLIAAEAAGVSTFLIATRPDWVRFYKYMLGFELIGEPALYPPGDIKIALLGGSLDQARKRQRMQNAFFKIDAREIASMRQALAPLLTSVEAA
ncbi:MAG TPA: acyl-homoserine-lactone synthase [Hyphomicrobium sp.]|nr:acyl-homoserine-lactone synthase [Hyphomicrobium sp.]